ncbi:MAG: HEAT repeat domain-containing protein [Candidatus Ozemobacteraceae bacterium]
MNSDKEIILQLSSPIKCFRVYALEQSIQTGSTIDLLRALENRESVEDDDECKAILSHALRILKNRFLKSAPSLVPEMVPEKILSIFNNLDCSSRLFFLESLPPEKIPLIDPYLPNLMDLEKDPVILTVLLRMYAREWNAEKVECFKKFLFFPQVSARVCSLEILTRKAPQSLLGALPELLSSKDCRIQASAIRGLAAIDMNEAISHLEDLLLENSLSQKLAALQVSIFLPFESIRESLIKFLAAENDVGLLEKTCIILAHNPDQEIPYRLWEIAENSIPAKATLLKSFLQPICQNLRASETLGKTFEAFMENLQNWIHKRNAQKLVHSCLEHVTESKPELLAELQQVIRKSLSKPFVKEAFSEALTWPLDEYLRKSLSSFLQTFEMQDGKAPPVVSADIDLANLSLDDQIRLVAFCSDAEREKVKTLLGRIFSLSTLPADLLATALRTSIKADIGDYVGNARLALKLKSPNAVSAAMEYLAKYDPDALFPFLGKYLQSPSARIKSTALKMLKEFDVSQSLSTLKAMLSQAEASQNQAVLSCMVYFDFSLVREMLARFLEKTSDPHIFLQGLCLFQANPDPEGLYSLYCISRKVSGGFVEQIEKAYLEVEIQLLKEKRIHPDTERRKTEFGLRFIAENQRKNRAPPPYSLQAIKMASFPFRGLMQSRVIQGGAFLFGIGLVLFLLFPLFSPSPELPKNPVELSSAADVVELRGEISEPGVFPGKFFLSLPAGETYVIYSANAKFEWLKKGDQVKVKALISPKKGTFPIEASLRSVVKVAFQKSTVRTNTNGKKQ